MDWTLSRRQCLAGISLSLLTASSLRGAGLDSVPLYPDDSHSLYRVRMTIEVEGNAEVPKNAVTTDVTRKLPVKADSVIDYEERLFRDGKHVAQAARRYYYEATTQGQVHKKDRKSDLRNEARRAIVQLSQSRVVLAAEQTQLTDQELQLLHTPVNSLAMDRLLPGKSVKIGDRWEIDDEVIASLLDMDAIQKSSLSVSLASFDDAEAKMQLSGSIVASVDGVPTSINLHGKMTFDRRQRAVSWLALGIREVRGVGKAEPGFEVAAQVRIIRQSLPKPHAVKNTEPIDFASPLTDDRLLIDVRSEAGGFSVFCDRRWRVMSANDRFTMMRMIDNDKIVAQCDVRSMPTLKEGHQVTLEAFQADIQRTLGDRFGEFLEAEEKVTSTQLRLLRVVAQGSVEKIPVQWIYTHFSDDSGRRCAAIFTLADQQVEAFAGGDIQFAEGFRFLETESKSDGEEVAEVGDSITKLK